MNKEYIGYEANELVGVFASEYARTGEPIPVNFRVLVPEFSSNDRYTHLIHSYPAKLLSQIPYFFLKVDKFCPVNGYVLDPFCGTGTVLLEAILAGKNAYGADANPLARLITQAKTTYISRAELEYQLQKILSDAQGQSECRIPDVSNIDYWFSKSTQRQLAKILHSIRGTDNDQQKVFFEVCFSNLIKKVSFADPRISVPVKLNPERFVNDAATCEKVKNKLQVLNDIDVLGRFKQICYENIARLSSLAGVETSVCRAAIISDDARVLTSSVNGDSFLEDESIDLILTSPPYAGAQKYIRSSSLNLSWLGLTLPGDMRKLDRENIGRENYYRAEVTPVKTGIPSADDLLDKLFNNGKQERGYIVGNYINEMKVAIDESVRVLKDSGYFVMVIGNNTVCGYEFNTQEYLSKYMESIGLKLQFKLIDDIKSYGLMTKRNKTADRISCEWILVFKKCS